jgi:two-component system, sensor histidine kinase and response regulator
MQVLVIEDEADVRSNIVEILGSGGFQSLDAGNGRAGLELARVHHPDLILCDIKMPDVDGYDVLQAIRHDPLTATIPFIFLTAKTDRAELRQGMNLGADDYLTKPFRRLELLETVSARIKKHEVLSQLEEKVADLQTQTNHKNDLLSTITHDLRAPLTTIKVALQMMETRPENRRQYSEIALHACEQGDELVQNLLDLYQLEAGESAIIAEPFDLQECLRRIEDSFQVRTRDYRQILTIDLPQVLPPMVTDGVTVRRILVELLNNACKYTPSQGEVILKVRESGEEEEVHKLCFTLRNPSEIPADALPRIFEKFYRVPGGDRAKRGGTGLGLALVHKLVQQLNGSIWVESQDGWTTFFLELPCVIDC